MGILEAFLNPGGQSSDTGLSALLGGLLNPGSLSPEQQQGLRAATARIAELSGPSRVPRSFMQIATSGLNAFDEGVQSARDRKALEEHRAMQRQLLDWQVKDAKSDYEHQQTVRDREGRIGKRTAGIWGPDGMPPTVAGMGQDGGGGLQQVPMASAMPGVGPNTPKVGGPDWLQNWQMQNGMPGPDVPRTKPGASSTFGLGFGLGLPLDLPRAANGGQAPSMPSPARGAERRNQTQMMVQNMMAEARIRFEEGDKAGAEKMLDMIQKFRPQATWKEVTEGNRVRYQAFFNDGEQGDMSDADVAAKLHFENVGPYTLGLDAYTGAERTRYKKGMSPAEAASYAAQRDRLRYEQQRDGRPVYSAEAGGFIVPPSKANPNGAVIPLAGSAARGPKMTEDQAKATGWLVQAENAWKNMQAVGFDAEGNLTSAARPGAADAIASIPSFGLTEPLGNSLRSADRQKFVQAASSLSESLLRAATGAGVTRDEAIQKIQELTPVFGEDDETTKQKMEAIPLYLDSLRVRSGPGANQAADVLARDEQRRGGAGKFSITTPDGRTFNFPDARSLANFKLTTGLK